jgi:two-component system, NarL family, nitrate/nitrite response regulator NarL
MNRSGLTRVAIVDQHGMFRDCLGAVLEMRKYDCHQVPVPDEGGHSDRVRARLLALRPDIALINADLGVGCSGTALMEAAARARIAVAALVDVDGEEHWGEYLAAGARIVVPKSASLSSVVAVIERLGYGEPVLDRAERERLMILGGHQSTEVRTAHCKIERLSAQESAVLRDLMGGRTVHEIAAARVVSDATVRTQVKAVLAKLEVSSQLSAVALAHLAGWTAHPVCAA